MRRMALPLFLLLRLTMMVVFRGIIHHVKHRHLRRNSNLNNNPSHPHSHVLLVSVFSLTRIWIQPYSYHPPALHPLHHPTSNKTCYVPFSPSSHKSHSPYILSIKTV